MSHFNVQRIAGTFEIGSKRGQWQQSGYSFSPPFPPSIPRLARPRRAASTSCSFLRQCSGGRRWTCCRVRRKVTSSTVANGREWTGLEKPCCEVGRVWPKSTLFLARCFALIDQTYSAPSKTDHYGTGESSLSLPPLLSPSLLRAPFVPQTVNICRLMAGNFSSSSSPSSPPWERPNCLSACLPVCWRVAFSGTCSFLGPRFLLAGKWVRGKRRNVPCSPHPYIFSQI